MDLRAIAQGAKAASKKLALASNDVKNNTLHLLADQLWSNRAQILAENSLDVQDAEQAGLTQAMIDRLLLNEKRLEGICADLRSVACLPDPVGEKFDEIVLANGLRVHKQRVPLGVLAVVYESRPNVTIDVAGLALKSGNSVILRGGSETLRSNRTLVKVVRETLLQNSLPVDCVQFIDSPDRSLVLELMRLYEYIDMLIPRGGAGLHRFCRENSLVPVITGGIGICHLFVDGSANLDKALEVVRNAKIQRPTVCNALDTVLVHRSAAGIFLPALVEKLAKDGVTFRVDREAENLLVGAELSLPARSSIQPAGPGDFDTEWLSLVLGIKVVGGLDEAVEHIEQHSTGHSDGILTGSQENAQHFISLVDSAVVYVNASTRFTDGAQMGLGAEIAISTQKLHARGPMALRELTTYKWVACGDYQVRI
ncbi:MAG TPA: glutamate-5-semialdehyde dehydrogenase [Anaerolineaceae bacterium]